MRHVTEVDSVNSLIGEGVSISEADLIHGSPRGGDMIARNPEDHTDKWLVAKNYFEDKFIKI